MKQNSVTSFLDYSYTLQEVGVYMLKNKVFKLAVYNEQEDISGYINSLQIIKAMAIGLPPSTKITELLTYFDSPSVQAIDNDDYSKLSSNELISPLCQFIEEKMSRLQASFDSIYNPVISIDQDENIQVFNEAAEEVFGRKAFEVVNTNIRKSFGTRNLVNVLQSGKSDITDKCWRGGKTFLSNRTPIVLEGKRIGAICVLQDISEIDKIVQQLSHVKQLNKELDAIIQSSFDGLCLTDSQAKILRVNKGFERIIDISSRDCVGRHMVDLVNEGHISHSGSIMALDNQQQVTTTLQLKNGKMVLVTSSPVFDDKGKIFMVVTNVRDFTELNHLQRKLEHFEGLNRLYQNELEQLKIYKSKELIYQSKAMKELLKMVARIAEADSTVLIQGESGVGKELIANIIHMKSCRSNGPLIKINCAAIPENLLESELFGYDSGAFSGASKNGKAGLFELADGGSLFLDEIAELPLNLQVKLLRVLQDRRIIRLGGNRTVDVDVRILTGTNRNLREMIATNQFRHDLYYRLNVIPVTVPPLRQRREDISVLASHFLNIFNAKYRLNKTSKEFSPEVISCFSLYHWPGNVRELENLVERLVVISPYDLITMDDLPFWIKDHSLEGDEKVIPLRLAVEDTERSILKKAFSLYKTTYDVAHVLKINQSTVVRKAAKYGIKPSK